MMRFLYNFFFVFFSYNLKNRGKSPFETAILQLTAAFIVLFIMSLHIVADLFNLDRGADLIITLEIMFCFFIYLYIGYLLKNKLRIDKETGLCEQYSLHITKKDKIFYWSVFWGCTVGIPFLYIIVKFYIL